MYVTIYKLVKGGVFLASNSIDMNYSLLLKDFIKMPDAIERSLATRRVTDY